VLEPEQAMVLVLEQALVLETVWVPAPELVQEREQGLVPGLVPVWHRRQQSG
jgi:hypothetical protein